MLHHNAPIHHHPDPRSLRLCRSRCSFRLRSSLVGSIVGAGHLYVHDVARLRLGAPVSVECIKQEGRSDVYFPAKSIVRFDFPARGTMPPVKIFWYDAMREDQPNIPNAPAGEILGDLPDNRVSSLNDGLKPHERQIIGEVFTDQFFSPKPAPTETRSRRASDDSQMTPKERRLAKWMSMIGEGTNGSLFIGDRGTLTTGTYGENTRLLPVEKMKDYEFPPEMLPRSPGHYRDWIRACKGGTPACSNFEVSAPFTEWIALGAIATKLQAGMGRRKDENHQQRRRRSATQAHRAQRLENRLEKRGGNCIASPARDHFRPFMFYVN